MSYTTFDQTVQLPATMIKMVADYLGSALTDVIELVLSIGLEARAQLRDS